jgi:hypothetical protein
MRTIALLMWAVATAAVVFSILRYGGAAVAPLLIAVAVGAPVLAFLNGLWFAVLPHVVLPLIPEDEVGRRRRALVGAAL